MRSTRRSLSLAVAAVSVSFGGLAVAGQTSAAQPLDTAAASATEETLVSTAADPANRRALTAAKALKEEAAAAAPDGPQSAQEKEFAQVDDYSKRVGGLGAYYDKAAGRYVIRMPRAAKIAASTVRIAGKATSVATSRTTAAEVNAVRTTLEDRKWKPEAIKYSYGFYYDAERDGVALNTTSPPEVVAPLLKQYPTLLPPKYGKGGRDSRRSDPAPHRGGASITNGNSTCTSGFTIVSTARYMVTAGHCFSIKQNVFSTGGQQWWGTVRNRPHFPYYDFEAIGGHSYGSVIYTGNATGWTTLVGGAADPAVGAAYCRSGQTTYERCSQVITSLNADFCDEAGCTPTVIAYKGPDGQGGDSGAPMYQYSGGKVHIRGLHFGQIDDTQYAEKWSTIRGVFRASIATR